MSDAATAGVVAVAVAVITAIVAPWLSRRRDARLEVEQERLEARTAVKAGKIATDAHREDWWRQEIETLRRTWQAENDSLRRQHEAETKRFDNRLETLQRAQEDLRIALSEYAAGLRVAEGFVLVPASTWQTVRDRLPDLPPARLPGETVAVPERHRPPPPPAEPPAT